MTNKTLVWYVVKENKIDEREFGFRKQRNTKGTMSKICDGFRRKEKTVAIFFGINKVYDKVNRENTLEELENMGIMMS